MIQPLIAAALLVAPQISTMRISPPPGSCLTRAEAGNLVRFALPTATAAVAERCAPALGATSFIASPRMSEFRSRLASAQPSWGDLQAAIAKLGGDKLAAGMSEGSARGVITSIFSHDIAKMRPADCLLADDMLVVLANSQPPQIVQLIVDVIAHGNDKGARMICPAA